MLIRILLIVVLVLNTSISFGDSIAVPSKLPDYDFGTVIDVKDGDSIVINLHYRGAQNVRILGLDAFETTRRPRIKKQMTAAKITQEEALQRGLEAKKIVNNLVYGKPVLLVFGDRKYGYYGRLLGTILFEKGNQWTNLTTHLLLNYPQLYVDLKQTR